MKLVIRNFRDLTYNDAGRISKEEHAAPQDKVFFNIWAENDDEKALLRSLHGSKRTTYFVGDNFLAVEAEKQ